MRTRHSLAATVVAIVAIVVGVIISLLSNGGPGAHADEPRPAPSVASSPAEARPAPKPKPKPKPAATTHATTSPKPSKAVVTTAPTSKRPKPPRLGAASGASGAAYAASADGRAFTMTHSSLEAGSEIGWLSRSRTTTIPVSGDTGDATLVLAVQGYVFVGDDTTATLTVTVNGASRTRRYHAGTDDTYTEGIDVPLRGASACRITLKVEVDGAEGYLNASVLDGRLE